MPLEGEPEDLIQAPQRRPLSPQSQKLFDSCCTTDCDCLIVPTSQETEIFWGAIWKRHHKDLGSVFKSWKLSIVHCAKLLRRIFGHKSLALAHSVIQWNYLFEKCSNSVFKKWTLVKCQIQSICLPKRHEWTYFVLMCCPFCHPLRPHI